MMIKIAERFRPFTHVPGTPCLLPQSALRFEIFPAYIRVVDLSIAHDHIVTEFPVKLKGPVRDFTVLQDLERPCIKVWGHSSLGYFRYRIQTSALAPGFVLIAEKSPEGSLGTLLPSEYASLDPIPAPPLIERLSFGVTKAADWTLVNRRVCLAEVLPFWYRLGALMPQLNACKHSRDSLTGLAEMALHNKVKLDLAAALSHLYLGGFEGMLCPTGSDPWHQGMCLPVIAPKLSPLHILKDGSTWIKHSLINHRAHEIDVLPCVLPALPVGRFCGISLGKLGAVDFEWTKKKARRLIFRSFDNQTVQFHFQKELRSFRLHTQSHDRGIQVVCGQPLDFQANTTYFMDRFEQ